jgi:uncharacterized YceG family protein
MTGNDVPGEEFLPGFGRPESEDWDDDDRRPARGGRGRPPRDDRYARERHAPDRHNDRDYDGRDFGGGDYDGGDYDSRGYDGRDDDDPDDGRPRKPRRKRSRARRLAPWIALLVLVIFLAAVGSGGLYAYHYLQAKDHPPDYAGAGAGPVVVVQVMSGDTPTSLAPRLVSDGVVKSTRAFILAAEHSTTPGGLEAGYYQMNRQMQASLAYAYLINPKHLVQDVVTIPEGYRAVNAIAVIAKKTHIPVADFQSVLKSPAKLGLPSYAAGKPEGYLFPATYAIEPHQTALQILQAMVSRFDEEAASANLPASVTIHAQGGTVHLTTGQLMIVASMVQAEAGRDSDFPKIAEVIYNRLAAGMKLQLDSTVFYGLGKYGTAASDAEISTPGPYNTYLNKGLPPTPIDSPGDGAIQAALHPSSGNLLYFFGCSSGTTIYSATQSLTSQNC